MNSKLMKLKDPVALFIGALGYAFILRLLNISCPILKLIGISCPGCGMTRALISAIKLDFTNAFHFHPLWLLLLIFALILTILYIFEKKRVFNVFLFILVILFLITYVYRLLFSDNTVVIINIEKGLIYQVLRFLFY